MEHGILKLLEARSDIADTLLGEQGGRASTVGRRVRGERHGAPLVTQALEAYTEQNPAPRRRTTGPARRPADRRRHPAPGRAPLPHPLAGYRS